MDRETKAPEERVVVLMVDDQAMFGEAVRRMLAEDAGIEFHFTTDSAGTKTGAAPSSLQAYTPSSISTWKCGLRFSALPKRWTKVTEPQKTDLE